MRPRLVILLALLAAALVAIYVFYGGSERAPDRFDAWQACRANAPAVLRSMWPSATEAEVITGPGNQWRMGATVGGRVVTCVASWDGNWDVSVEVN